MKLKLCSIQYSIGANISQLERDIGSEQFPPNEHYFGLVNFGNTCYSNSVLQALYFCRPFREKVLEYKAKNKRTKETLLTCLADLFYSIATQKKKVGSIAPKKFIARLRKEKEEFDNYMQQDAHEFLNFLINHINEIILAERNQSTLKVPKHASGEPVTCNGTAPPTAEPTWVDVGQNTSITHCLKCFSDTETLCNDNKFKCDNCSSYQEAQKRMRVKKLPLILALHLKRFKYMEQYNRHIKKIDASAIEDFYGLTSDIQKSSETGYILFYQSRDARKPIPEAKLKDLKSLLHLIPQEYHSFYVNLDADKHIEDDLEGFSDWKGEIRQDWIVSLNIDALNCVKDKDGHCEHNPPPPKPSPVVNHFSADVNKPSQLWLSKHKEEIANIDPESDDCARINTVHKWPTVCNKTWNTKQKLQRNIKKMRLASDASESLLELSRDDLATLATNECAIPVPQKMTTLLKNENETPNEINDQLEPISFEGTIKKSKGSHIQFHSAHFDIRSSPIKPSSTVFRKFQINPDKMEKLNVQIIRPLALEAKLDELNEITPTTSDCNKLDREITSDVLRVVGEARAGSLGPFSPSFNIQNVLLEGMDKYLPHDVHKIVSGKLHISLTRVNVANTSIELSKQNITRLGRILFPPKPEVLSNMCKQGFDDALRFLHRNNMISCTRCLAVQSTFQLQEVLSDTVYDYDLDCEECKTHRQHALVDDLPDTVMTIFQNAIDSANHGIVNWVMRQRAVRYVGDTVEKHSVQYNVAGNMFVLRKKCIRHNNTMTSIARLEWMKMTEIYDVTDADTEAVQSPTERDVNKQLEFDNDWSSGMIADIDELVTDELDGLDEDELGDRNLFSDPESEWRRDSLTNSESDGEQPESDQRMPNPMVGKGDIKGSRIFHQCYVKCCKLQNLTPLGSVIPSGNGKVLDFCVDRIKYSEWPPILNAMSFLEHIDCERLAKTVNKRAVILTNFMLTNLLEAALLANNSLRHVFLPRCLVGDAGCLAICKAVRCMPNILTLDLSGCELTPLGASYIADLLKYQKIHRYSENWVHTLRYRLPDLDQMAGLRRVSVCGNPLGDAGAAALLTVLADDLWIKAMDLQNCELTESTAQTVLQMMESNTTLVVLDLRHNPAIASESLGKVRGALRRNETGGVGGQYSWLSSVSVGSGDGRSVKPIASKNGITKDRVVLAARNSPTKYASNKTTQLEELNLQLVDQMKQLKQQQIRLWANNATSSGSEQSFQESSGSFARSSSSGSSCSVPIDQNTLSYIQQAFRDIYSFIKNNQCTGQCQHEIVQKKEVDPIAEELSDVTEKDELEANELHVNIMPKKAQSTHMKLTDNGKMNKMTKSKR
ncbi:hypothetical protein MSG28_001811 [Choristoneura fumiferana]|uniref:Uncharacterized protein n=1 Tax=Choristoneura fumiferana TaxID=7141 RepID=A0ACC0KVT3_CHOFU|nr:hypothetical protein MSG28_001811 [Choristoneura fumiferana]